MNHRDRKRDRKGEKTKVGGVCYCGAHEVERTMRHAANQIITNGWGWGL